MMQMNDMSYYSVTFRDGIRITSILNISHGNNGGADDDGVLWCVSMASLLLRWWFVAPLSDGCTLFFYSAGGQNRFSWTNVSDYHFGTSLNESQRRRRMVQTLVRANALKPQLVKASVIATCLLSLVSFSIRNSLKPDLSIFLYKCVHLCIATNNTVDFAIFQLVVISGRFRGMFRDILWFFLVYIG